MLLFEANEWKQEEINLAVDSGKRRVNAEVKDGWGVSKAIGGGTGWAVTHIPSGREAIRLKTKIYAKMMVDDMVKRFPWAVDASTEKLRVEFKTSDEFREFLHMYATGRGTGTAPNLTAPQRDEKAARLQRLAQMGDDVAIADLARIQRRRGEEKPSVTSKAAETRRSRVADIRPLVKHMLDTSGLQRDDAPYGKAGTFYGVNGGTRALSLAKNTLLVNIKRRDIKHYVGMGGRPKMTSSWIMYDSYDVKKVNQRLIDEQVQWVKAGISDDDLIAKVKARFEKASKNVTSGLVSVTAM